MNSSKCSHPSAASSASRVAASLFRRFASSFPLLPPAFGAGLDVRQVFSFLSMSRTTSSFGSSPPSRPSVDLVEACAMPQRKRRRPPRRPRRAGARDVSSHALKSEFTRCRSQRREGESSGSVHQRRVRQHLSVRHLLRRCARVELFAAGGHLGVLAASAEVAAKPSKAR